MPHLKKRITVIIVGLGIIFGLASYLSRDKPVEVVSATVELGLVEETVANTRAGSVKACRRAGLSPAIGGQISALPVVEGDVVTQGQLILSLWNDDLRAHVDLAESQAIASRARAEASCLQANVAQRDAQRLQKLQRTNAISEEALDAAVTNAKAKQADCSAAHASADVSRAQLGVAHASLERTILRAPFDGVIAQINAELAEYVTPSPPGIATLPAIDLVDNTCFFITAPIDEIDAPAIKPGMIARISLDAFPGQRFAGRVKRVSDFVLVREKQARTVDVDVEFSSLGQNKKLLAGYSADAEVILTENLNTLRIPTEAVMENQTVLILNTDDDVLELRNITTGIANWDWTEITGGLKEGERVVTSLDRLGVEADAYAIEEPAQP